nr:hypothetical protein [Psychrobacter sp. I-STPA10]
MKNIKAFLLTGYVSIGFIYAIYSNFFGQYQYKSFAYNIGRALVWPASMFPSVGKFLGGIVVS